MRCELAIVLALAACVPDGTDKRDLGHVPTDLEDGWRLSSPEAEGFDPDALDALYRWWLSEDAPATVRSLLIVHDGALIAEGYARSLDDRERLRRIASVSKSVTSLLFGVAQREGFVQSVDERLETYLPDAFADGDDARRAIAFRDLLTMRSGLDFDEESEASEIVLHHSNESARWVLSHPLEHAPGTHFRYSSGDTQLVGAALVRATGMPLADYARTRLFEPLGISASQWDTGDDGVAFAFGGLWLRPRDLARIGQMVLDGGQWNGTEVVPSQWLAESVTPRANLNEGPYGYFWRIRPEQQAFTATGRGGTFIYVVPSARLVVVHTADPGVNWPAGLDLTTMDDMVDRILAARR